MSRSSNILLYIAIAVIAYLFYYTRQLESRLSDEFKREIRQIDSKIKTADSTIIVLDRYIAKLRKQDAVMSRKIKKFTYKLSKYEKITNIRNINRLDKDSIRAIITAE